MDPVGTIWVNALQMTIVPLVVSLLIALVLREVAPRIPGSLVAVAFGIVIVNLLGLDQQGVDIVGPIQSGLPSFGLPNVGAVDYLTLAGPAAGQPVVTFIDSFGSPGSGNGQFAIPAGVAVSPTGQVYVADLNNNRLQRFDADGTYQTQ